MAGQVPYKTIALSYQMSLFFVKLYYFIYISILVISYFFFRVGPYTIKYM